MKKIGYLLLIIFGIFIIEGINAKNITLDYPSNVKTGEEFNIKINLLDFDAKLWDVKIDLLNDKEERIAQIYNNEVWKSTYYYIKGAIDSSIETTKEFKLKIISDYEGKAKISTKLKSGSTYSFEGYSINIEQGLIAEKKEETKKKTEKDSEEDKETKKETEQTIVKEQENIIIETIPEQKTIILGKSIDLEKEIIYKSKNEYIKEYLIYGFSLLCLILIALLLIEDKKERK